MEMNGVREVNSEVPGLAEISRSYMNDFIAEIREILEKIEIELVDLEVDPDNPDHLNTVYNSFNTIRGLAGLLHDPVSIRIVAASGSFLKLCKNMEPRPARALSISSCFRSDSSERYVKTAMKLKIHCSWAKWNSISVTSVN